MSECSRAFPCDHSGEPALPERIKAGCQSEDFHDLVYDVWVVVESYLGSSGGSAAERHALYYAVEQALR